MKTNKLILYRLGKNGLEILLEKAVNNNLLKRWQLPQVNIEQYDKFDHLKKEDKVIELEENVSNQKFLSCFAVRQFDYISAVKKRIFIPVIIKGGTFFLLNKIPTDKISSNQQILIKELAMIVTEREMLCF